MEAQKTRVGRVAYLSEDAYEEDNFSRPLNPN
jgi:hypothetical protein